MQLIKVKGINLRTVLTLLILGCFLGGLSPVTPALAQGPGGGLLEKPPTAPPPEEKKEGAPSTCGPMISDSCMPIETHHASVQMGWALPIVGSNVTTNWRRVSAHGDFKTFVMPVKFTYGPAKNLETYIVVPFINNFANNLDPGIAGPNGERSANYGGIGDITAVAKYNLLPEGDIRPAVTGVFGVGFPAGHAHHLNPRFLGQDAVGTGAFTFTTGFNLYKWVKPFLLYSNIWLNSPVNIFPIKGSDVPTAVRSREFVTFNLAAELPLGKKFVALVEMYSNWTWANIPTTQGFQSPQTVVGILPGIEFLATEKWTMAAGASIDLLGKNGTLKYTPMLTMAYAF
jgi:hypothetical protein